MTVRPAVDDPTWPFGDDADCDDPLTAMRIAVTSSHPRWSYLVSFDRQSQERPTDAEAAMLASYLDEYKSHWYRPSFAAQLLDRPLDVDGGANGVVFHKWGVDDWGFRRRSYTMGYLYTVVPPTLRATRTDGVRGPLSLLRVLDWLHCHSDNSPSPRWTAWKASHPAVLPSSAVEAGDDQHA